MTALATEMEKQGWKLARLSRVTGLNYRTLGNYYRGVRTPPVDVALQISTALDRPVAVLFPLSSGSSSGTLPQTDAGATPLPNGSQGTQTARFDASSVQQQ